MEALLHSDALFLGFDSSTQLRNTSWSLKVTALDTSLRVVASDAVNFDAELPLYGTSGGVHAGPRGRVTAPARMWMEAFDKLLLKLKASEFPFHRVRAVSGSGQQHGTVYWRQGARERLKALSPGQSLVEQLAGQLSAADSPVWMDSSTAAQCRAIEAALGGPQALATLSGSRAFERYSGPQIRKLAEEAPAVYAETERVSLVSSFGASLLLGDYAPIDHSDGAGMNLMGLSSRDWAPQALQATAPGLAERLGPLVPSHGVLGPIHGYHVVRFGFNPECCVVAWSGDNPCSLAGLALQEAGDVAISLGTSDTVFAVVKDPHPSLEGHVFPSPVDPTGQTFMLMLVYKNASLTREEIKDRCANGSWDEFEKTLASTQALNGGAMGFYYSQPEILPPLPAGVHRFRLPEDSAAGAEGAQPVGSFEPHEEIRAVVEGQLVAMRGHAERIGLQSPPRRIMATGGASANRSLLRIMANVFGCPVYTGQTTNSAAVGAALRAAHGLACQSSGNATAFGDLLRSMGTSADSVTRLTEVATPESEELWKAYGRMTQVRMEMEQKLLQSSAHANGAEAASRASML